MAGFDSIIVLLGLLVIPALYLIYNQMIKKRRKAAIKFSNLMFVKSAISNKKKSKRDMWIFMISLVIIALMIIGFADPHIPLEQSKEGVNTFLEQSICFSDSLNEKDCIIALWQHACRKND